jgi:FkbM family methyltransferase
MGNFTLLALGHGPGVRVVAVEGCEEPLAKLRKSIAANGWDDRVQVCQKFIGGVTRAQEEFAEVQRHTVDFISEQEFIDRYGIGQIDFLKCDIEGSEFDLLKPGSLLLNRARQLAVELHAWAGDMDAFVRMLKEQGFETRVVGGSVNDQIVQARRPAI